MTVWRGEETLSHSKNYMTNCPPGVQGERTSTVNVNFASTSKDTNPLSAQVSF